VYILLNNPMLIALCWPAGKPFSVLGFGSSSYPRFCAAADTLHTAMLAATGTTTRSSSSSTCSAILPPAKADAVAGEEGVVWPWVKQVVGVMCSKGWLGLSGMEAVLDLVPAAACAAEVSDNLLKPESWHFKAGHVHGHMWSCIWPCTYGHVHGHMWSCSRLVMYMAIAGHVWPG
jgi:hypothetical protein